MNTTCTTTLKMLVKTQTRKLQAAQRDFCMPDWKKEKLQARLEKNVARYIELTGELPEWK